MTSASFDADKLQRVKTVELTTTGRRSGKPRAVKIWFVVDGPRSILVQHVAKKPAMWYRNLSKSPQVRVDFGDGPIDAVATPLESVDEVQAVVEQIGKKYWSYRIIRLFGAAKEAVAARIEIV